MPDPVTTFSCPHCQAQYPFKQVLVDRVVRCTACKKPFRLAANGIAAPVQIPSPQPPPAAAQAATDSGYYAPHKSTVSDALDIPRPPSTRSGRSRSSTRLNAAQEKTRRLMTSSLNEAASSALAKAAQQDQIDKVKSERITRSRSSTRLGVAVKTSDGRELGPAILTGEGENTSRLRRMSALIALAAVVLVVIIWLVLKDRSDQARLLRQWAAPGTSSEWVYPSRSLTMRSRALLYNPTMPLVVNLADAQRGTIRQMELSPLSVFNQGEYRWSRSLSILVHQQAWDHIHTPQIGAERILDESVLRGLRIDAPAIIDQQNFMDESIRAGWDELAAGMVWRLFVASDEPGREGLVQHWLRHNFSGSMYVQPIQGQSHVLHDMGQRYRGVVTSFTGQLVRFTDVPVAVFAPSIIQVGGWMVYDLQTDV